jgi:hypothetical protein
MNMKIQYYKKIRWGLAPLAPNDAPPLKHGTSKDIYFNEIAVDPETYGDENGNVKYLQRKSSTSIFAGGK